MDEEKEFMLPEKLAVKVRAIAEREALAEERAGPVVHGQRMTRPPRTFFLGGVI